MEGGNEQIVFQDMSNPNQVLKIQSDISVNSPFDARKKPSLMNIRLSSRNKVPYQLHSKLEGFIKVGNRYYPVLKQKKITPMPKMSSTIIESAIKPRITNSLQEKGFTLKDGRYIRGNTILEDIKPDNMGIDESGTIRFFDV